MRWPACLWRQGAREALTALMLFFPCATAHAQPTPSAVSTPSAVTQVPAVGVDTALDARAKAVSKQLRCPVCQGESIQDSPAELSTQMRTLVREQLANGRSEPEVIDYFVQRYGQSILLAPTAKGFNLLLYWLPVVFLLVGGVVIGKSVSRWTRPATGDASGDA